jgi:hypothetical protein
MFTDYGLLFTVYLPAMLPARKAALIAAGGRIALPACNDVAIRAGRRADFSLPFTVY